tara:strand:- start:151 stop:1116 length:966 start_codon:yes stop_codon:yes gene_type:complete
MSVIIYIENENGQVKKSSIEAAYYGGKLANQLGCSAIGVSIGDVDDSLLAALGQQGLSKVVKVSEGLSDFDASAYSKVIEMVYNQESGQALVMAFGFSGKSISSRMSVKLKAGLVTGVIDFPNLDNGFIVKKSVFSGKAFANVKINTENKIIAVLPNSFSVEYSEGSAEVITLDVSEKSGEAGSSVVEVKKVQGKTPLTEAELVVSAGRGLKGPENWGMVEELADLLGATTACSRPVSDMGWRPHGEHVGQTGIAIRPNLYIAIGISGAIQHLAGVNGSKVIVVINKDPEAPFFKAADYGIVGDAFEVVPKLIAEIKNQNN